MTVNSTQKIILQDDNRIFETFASKNISESIESFFIEYFRAAVKVENEVSSSGVLSISHVGLVGIFKSIINQIFGRSQLKVRRFTDKNLLFIIFKWQTEKEDANIISSLKSDAEISGFAFSDSSYESEGKLSLTAKLMPHTFIPIYAKSKKKIYDAFYKEFILGNEKDVIA